MSQPKTLLEMAGADMTPNALSDSTLVLIDCQMEYVTGAVPLPGVDDALAEAGKVLARARAAAAPVVHIVRQGHRPAAPSISMAKAARSPRKSRSPAMRQSSARVSPTLSPAPPCTTSCRSLSRKT